MLEVGIIGPSSCLVNHSSQALASRSVGSPCVSSRARSAGSGRVGGRRGSVGSCCVGGGPRSAGSGCVSSRRGSVGSRFVAGRQGSGVARFVGGRRGPLGSCFAGCGGDVMSWPVGRSLVRRRMPASLPPAASFGCSAPLLGSLATLLLSAFRPCGRSLDIPSGHGSRACTRACTLACRQALEAPPRPGSCPPVRAFVPQVQAKALHIQPIGAPEVALSAPPSPPAALRPLLARRAPPSLPVAADRPGRAA